MRDDPIDRSRWLQTPCAFRLGGRHPTSRPLTSSVAPWVLARDLRSRVRRRVSRLSSGNETPHIARTLHDPIRLEMTPHASSGCLPSVRSRPCGRAKPFAFPFTFARRLSHPFARSVRAGPVKTSPSSRATPCDLGLPRGSPRRHGEDASRQPLQSTFDTSTRESFDFRARLAPPVRESGALTAGCFPDRDRVLPCGAGPPRGNPAPAGCALDGASPASIDTRTISPSCRPEEWVTVAVTTLARRFRPSIQGWRSTSDAPCRSPRGIRAETRIVTKNQDRFRRPHVKEDGIHGPERLPSTAAPKTSRSRDASDWREPATGVAALPPTTRLPTLLHLPDALARRG